MLGISPTPAPLMPRTFSRGRLTLPVSPSRTLRCVAVGDAGVKRGPFPRLPPDGFTCPFCSVSLTGVRPASGTHGQLMGERSTSLQTWMHCHPFVQKVCVSAQKEYVSCCHVYYRQSVNDGSWCCCLRV